MIKGFSMQYLQEYERRPILNVNFFPVLGALPKLRKITISFAMSVGSHVRNFHGILYLSIFRKYVEKTEV